MVVTVLNNGRPMKPQTFATETSAEILNVKKGDLVDFTNNKSTLGSTQEKSPFLEKYNPDKDWTEDFWFDGFSKAEKLKKIRKN